MFKSTADSKLSALPIVTALCALKLLLINAYRSTDFEVHRNWLAITSSLPLNEWYTADHSEWTLDYPPFFAFFEFFLSFFAQFFDAEMLKVSNLNYASERTILFQRLSVIVTDFVYIYAAYKLSKTLSSKNADRNILFAFFVCNVGLIMVDSVHFQYNGFLSGILLLAIDAFLENRYLLCGFWFSSLLNLKHIYLYLTPAFFAYLLRAYCLEHRLTVKFRNTAKLGAIVILIFTASLTPFLGQFSQLLKRLFPFKRGLTHAYWAPNFWALYNFADFLLARALGRKSAGYTSGLVQEFDHLVLPNILPIHTLLLTVLAIFPFFLHACFVLSKRRLSFVRLIVICALASFLFGWHVHEKAILLATIPLAALSLQSPSDGGLFLILSSVGNFSLFPLLFEDREWILKILLWIAQTILVLSVLRNRYGPNLISWFGLAYIFIGPLCIEVYAAFVQRAIGFDSRFPFLPLMLSSVYCAFGVVYCWLMCCVRYAFEEEINVALRYYVWRWLREQERLKKRLALEGATASDIRYVGGVDITMEKDSVRGCACLVVLELPTLREVYRDCEIVYIETPYKAGFLAFREIPPLTMLIGRCVKNCKFRPDVILVDGNGILHPAGFGLASHLGVLCDLPTIGVAKNLHLVDGLVRERASHEDNDYVELVGKESGKTLGVALRTSPKAIRRVYVSIGHRINLQTAVHVVLACSTGSARVPEPTRLADIYSRDYLKENV